MSVAGASSSAVGGGGQGAGEGAGAGDEEEVRAKYAPVAPPHTMSMHTPTIRGHLLDHQDLRLPSLLLAPDSAALGGGGAPRAAASKTRLKSTSLDRRERLSRLSLLSRRMIPRPLREGSLEPEPIFSTSIECRLSIIALWAARRIARAALAASAPSAIL